MAVKLVPCTADQDLTSLKKEMDILRQCRNAHIVSYYGCWGPDSESRLWILMELVEMGSLCDLLADATPRPSSSDNNSSSSSSSASPPSSPSLLPSQPRNVENKSKPSGPLIAGLSEAQIAYVMRGTLLALAYLHAKHIMHRDVKGGNILIDRHGSVKLADFGVSKQMAASMSAVSAESRIVGSPLWMAPEVIAGGAGYNQDIWSLGITAIEIAEGWLPHSQLSLLRVLRAITTSDPPKLRGSHWSSEFKSFLAVCLIKDASKRPQAVELLTHPFVTSHQATRAKGGDIFADLLAARALKKARLLEEKKRANPNQNKKDNMRSNKTNDRKRDDGDDDDGDDDDNDDEDGSSPDPSGGGTQSLSDSVSFVPGENSASCFLNAVDDGSALFPASLLMSSFSTNKPSASVTSSSSSSSSSSSEDEDVRASPSPQPVSSNTIAHGPAAVASPSVFQTSSRSVLSPSLQTPTTNAKPKPTTTTSATTTTTTTPVGKKDGAAPPLPPARSSKVAVTNGSAAAVASIAAVGGGGTSSPSVATRTAIFKGGSQTTATATPHTDAGRSKPPPSIPTTTTTTMTAAKIAATGTSSNKESDSGSSSHQRKHSNLRAFWDKLTRRNSSEDITVTSDSNDRPNTATVVSAHNNHNDAASTPVAGGTNRPPLVSKPTPKQPQQQQQQQHQPQQATPLASAKDKAKPSPNVHTSNNTSASSATAANSNNNNVHKKHDPTVSTAFGPTDEDEDFDAHLHLTSSDSPHVSRRHSGTNSSFKHSGAKPKQESVPSSSFAFSSPSSSSSSSLTPSNKKSPASSERKQANAVGDQVSDGAKNKSKQAGRERLCVLVVFVSTICMMLCSLWCFLSPESILFALLEQPSIVDHVFVRMSAACMLSLSAICAWAAHGCKSELHHPNAADDVVVVKEKPDLLLKMKMLMACSFACAFLYFGVMLSLLGAASHQYRFDRSAVLTAVVLSLLICVFHLVAGFAVRYFANLRASQLHKPTTQVN